MRLVVLFVARQSPYQSADQVPDSKMEEGNVSLQAIINWEVGNIVKPNDSSLVRTKAYVWLTDSNYRIVGLPADGWQLANNAFWSWKLIMVKSLCNYFTNSLKDTAVVGSLIQLSTKGYAKTKAMWPEEPIKKTLLWCKSEPQRAKVG